jgi:hypothetical protein
MAKGGSSNQPVKQEVTQSNLPEYARPYFEGLMTRANADLTRPYIPYGYTQDPKTGDVVKALDAQGNPINPQRIADFTQQQTDLQKNILNQQTPGQFGTATNLATAAGLGSLRAGQYAPGQFDAQQIGMPNLQQYSMGAPNMVQGGEYGSPQMQAAQTGFSPQVQAYMMGGARDVGAQGVSAQDMQAAQSGYRPDLKAFQMGPAERIGGYDVNAPMMQAAQTSYGQGPLEQFRIEGPQAFGLEQAQKYMSPFAEAVMEPQKREAIRSAKQSQLVQDLGAARQGTYGGSRQLLAGLERERNLGQQLGDIDARGRQAAFENAQQQFERDRAAGITTGQQNLQAALQQQQLGVSTGLQASLANLSNEQQANVNNQAMQFQAQGMSADNAMKAALANQQAGLTTGQQNLAARLSTQELGAQQNLQTAMQNLSNEQQSRVNNQAQQFQAQGMNADNALRAALANQGVDVTRAQANQQAQMQAQQLGTQTGMQTALANLDSASQANVQNLAAQLQTQGMNAEQAMRAALANQQAQLTTGQQNLQAALQTQQLGAQTGLSALQSNQQADLDRQRMAEQSRQFGSQQRLAGLGQAGQMGQTLTNIGSAQSQADIARFGQQTQTAAQQQALDQQYLDMAYQNFLRQQGYPMEQLQQYSSLLRGVPVTPSSTTATYAQQPGIGQQLLGTGLGAASIYKTFAGA